MFKDNLKTLRKQKGYSQEQLAFRLNVVRQTVSKWEKGTSVPDAELTVRLAELLEVDVSDLLGSKIEAPDDKNELARIADELSKQNELLVLYANKISKFKKSIAAAIAIVLFILFIAAIYESWGDMWHEFGQNLYHLLNN